MLNIKGKYGLKISFATDEDILKSSYGEVTKPETINYKSSKAEEGGLFDERIFGPTKSFECSCGKYKKISSKYKRCERCGVEITESIVRRERMGHIKLEEPVTHIWMLKCAPSRIASALDMKSKDIDKVVYFISYVVIDPGNCKNIKSKMVLDLSGPKDSIITREILSSILHDILTTLSSGTFAYNYAIDMIEDLKDTSLPFSINQYIKFISKYTGAQFGIGASAIEALLKRIDLDLEIKKINTKLSIIKTSSKKTQLIKQLSVLSSFKLSNNRPEVMVIRYIRVMPPDLRPIIQLDGGRFTTSEINDLYRRIIIRNERLKKIKSMNAPLVIINNEKRMLQEAVDALFDNERKVRPILSKDKRPLKSLTAILKGKQGRFRQNLLGKRVDYSGRSVIVVGPTLKMYQCGIPQDIAIVLFKPFLIYELVKKGIADNFKIAEKMIKNREDKVWYLLEKIIKNRPVLLNRAPTLHRLGIQAFESKLVKGKAIRLHPLVTTAFNADFDGDQMAIHLPITQEAIAEARTLMIATKNILGLKDGKPISVPTQDMLLGNYFLTKEEKDVLGQGMIFKSPSEMKIALANKKVSLHAIIGIRISSLVNKEFANKVKNFLLITSVGKVIFNEIFTEKFPYLNCIDCLKNKCKNTIVTDLTKFKEIIANYTIKEPFKSKDFSEIIISYFNKYNFFKTAKMLDNLKDLGFKYSTISGTTIAASDIKTYTKKYELFKVANKKVSEINHLYNEGFYTNNEKHNKIINIWTDLKNEIQNELNETLKADPNNPIFMMSDSGARGNISNFTQLVGMRGLMNNPKGEVIEIPIKSSFMEGLKMSEFFNSTHGARKGMADVALKTADSGYLTRRLVDVSQEVIVSQEDCFTNKGHTISDIKETKYSNIIVPLKERLLGRELLNDLKCGDVIIPKNKIITLQEVDLISNFHDKVTIRSVLTCETERGVCVKCYGQNMAEGKEVKVGEAVGIIAAQSIGEPGTQLTMRTFHTGGVAGGTDITQGLPRIKELLDITVPKGAIALISEIDGKVKSIRSENNFYTIEIEGKVENRIYKTEYNAILRVKKNAIVKRGQKLTEGSINIKELLEVAQVEDVQDYILKEIQKVYRLQGIEISDKYIEIIIRQMLSKVRVVQPNDSALLPMEIISKSLFKKYVKKAFNENKIPPVSKQIILGIKKAPLESESFLSAASFQDTTRVLVKAILKGQVDYLWNLKENIMLGNLIPAGTGLKDHSELIENCLNANKLYEY